jgi:hypothetical protein
MCYYYLRTIVSERKVRECVPPVPSVARSISRLLESPHGLTRIERLVRVNVSARLPSLALFFCSKIFMLLLFEKGDADGNKRRW